MITKLNVGKFLVSDIKSDSKSGNFNQSMSETIQHSLSVKTRKSVSVIYISEKMKTKLI